MLNHTSRLGGILAILAATLLLGITSGGCGTEQADYDAAVAEGTADALREFLDVHPDGQYAPLARPDLDELQWKEAEASGTAEAYETYLADHPDGIHAQAAETAAPKAAWKEMDFINDRAAIEAFLGKYEHSAYGNKARERMALLDLYPSHLSFGEPVLTPSEAGGWEITAEVKNIGTQGIDKIGFRVGFEDKDGVIVAQRDSAMGVPEGEEAKALAPGETRTFQLDVAPQLIPEGWIEDAEHVRLVLSTMVLAGA